MFKRVINAVMGSRHERDRKKIQPIVDEINAQYARLRDVSEIRGSRELEDEPSALGVPPLHLGERVPDVAAEHDRPFVGVDDDDLMPGGVPRRR